MFIKVKCGYIDEIGSINYIQQLSKFHENSTGIFGTFPESINRLHCLWCSLLYRLLKYDMWADFDVHNMFCQPSIVYITIP